MTSLRQRYIEDMQVRNFSPVTQASYTREVLGFARYFNKSPELLGPEQIRAYQVYLTNERKLGIVSISVATSALRFLYRVTLKKNWCMADMIPAPKVPKKLPIILSPEEVVRFLDCVAMRKHRAVLTTCYAAGLRISEAVALTLPAIDSRRMVLRGVVPGGGISLDGARWISCRPNFFVPVKVLSRLFRRLFLQYLQEAFDAGKLRFFTSLQALQDPQAFNRHLDLARDVEWVVYAKPPFAGPQQVVDYVGRYTHRVAISNHRIVDIEDGQVKFKWRDYRDNNQQKTMPLTADEFIRRFLLHVLPSGFHRIRYYGFLGNRHRKEKLEHCRHLLGMASPKEGSAEPTIQEDYRDRYERLTGRSLRECPVCHRGRMIAVKALPQVRSSPTIQNTS
jgi:hypothetical protein